ncbi:AAA family ATPase [uncultured Roseobacter sp.]|uniref:ATP-dependent DNA helicase n=1 Tax=uncultured Roseobacter sp. TaxID=114847 RepID=UPI0026312E35|nr:AAA family ATPase [uncultured Roseobacter sp.]
MAVALSKMQAEARDFAQRWFKAGQDQVFRIWGYAGTGKSTSAQAIVSATEAAPCYGAYTGKAAAVMRKHGCEGAATLHSLIYEPRQRPDGGFDFEVNKDGPLSECDLIVVDEVSMVDRDIGEDLLSFKKPLLVLGDPEQLPPPNDKGGYFTQADPDVFLTEIHRQAEGDPIVRLATEARLGRSLPMGWMGKSRVVRRSDMTGVEMMNNMVDHDQVISGKRDTRAAMNSNMRRKLGFQGLYPLTGERLVCRRNNRDLGIYNGGSFTVMSDAKEVLDEEKGETFLHFLVRSEDEPDLLLEVKVHPCHFPGGGDKPHWKTLRGSEEFEYGYALTCHLSQGSQWPSVLIKDESHVFGQDAKRWLYTAITRASEQVTVVI